MEQRHPVTLTYSKQNLPDNLALQARIVPFPVHSVKPSKCARTAPENVCSILKLRCDSAQKSGGWRSGVHVSWMQLESREQWTLEAMGVLEVLGRALMQWAPRMGWGLQCSGVAMGIRFSLLVLGELGVG